MRAAWTGYARALQLQSTEIEEIDLFSWGCGLKIPGRPAIPSHVDLFDRWDDWRAALRDTDKHQWRDRLPTAIGDPARSEEHTSELQSLMRISYAVFCLKKKKQTQPHTNKH